MTEWVKKPAVTLKKCYTQCSGGIFCGFLSKKVPLNASGKGYNIQAGMVYLTRSITRKSITRRRGHPFLTQKISHSMGLTGERRVDPGCTRRKVALVAPDGACRAMIKNKVTVNE